MTAIAVIGSWSSAPSADALRAALPDDRVIAVQGEDLGPAAEAEAAFGGFSMDRLRSALTGLPKLRWVHTFSAGVDRHVQEMAKFERVLLTNNSGAYDAPISEHVIAMIFAAAKRVPEHLAAQGRHEWQRETPHAEVRGQTLVILGMGSIGSELARLASGVGMRVIGIRREASRPGGPGVERIVSPDRAPVSRSALVSAMIPWPHIVLQPSLWRKSTPRSPSAVTGSVGIAPYMSACPRGSNTIARRRPSRCSRA